MRLLLDTHTLLWWLNDDEKLGGRARGLIGDPANDVLVSAVSLWEITVKLRIGKLDADIEEILGIPRAKRFSASIFPTPIWLRWPDCRFIIAIRSITSSWRRRLPGCAFRFRRSERAPLRCSILHLLGPCDLTSSMATPSAGSARRS